MAVKSGFLFDHIYKAGGSSVDRAFIIWVGEDNATPTLFESLSAAQIRYANKKYITGHFSLKPGHAIAPERIALTLLRDPVDRVLSHYFFSRHQVTLRGHDPAVQFAKSLPLADYIESTDPDVLHHIRNFQARHFAPLAWNGRDELTETNQVELAKCALEQYDLVGILDEILDYLVVVAGRYGFRQLEAIPHVNSTQGRPGKYSIDPGVRKRIEVFNEGDRDLIEYARKLFARARTDALRRTYLPSNSESANNGTGMYDANCERILRDDSPAADLESNVQLGSGDIEILSVRAAGKLTRTSVLFSGETCLLSIAFRANSDLDDVAVGFEIVDESDRLIFGTNTFLLGKQVRVQSNRDYVVRYSFRCDIGRGRYFVGASLHPSNPLEFRIYHWRKRAGMFEVTGNMGYHFEGVLKLYANIDSIESTNLGEPQKGISKPRSEWPTIQRMNVIGPPLFDFRAIINARNAFLELRPNELVAIEVNLVNTGKEIWQSEGVGAVRVSYHWWRDDHFVVEFDGERTALPYDMEPGSSATAWVSVKAPSNEGDYLLRMTLVQDGVAWFDEEGDAFDMVPVRVTINAEMK